MAVFQLASIYRQLFGQEPPRDLSKEITLEQAKERVLFASNGQPYYKEDAFGREYFMPVTIDDWLVPFAVIGADWKKIIVKTPMPQRGGSVKEEISIDDYVITIKGIFIRDEGEFPESEITDLDILFNKGKTVSIRSVFTDIFLKGKYSHQCVIHDIKWPPVTGTEHAKPFIMQLESDSIFDLSTD